MILEGYAHLDLVTAFDNQAVSVIAEWIERLDR